MRKRLFFDIETSPNVGVFWNPGHKISLSSENIIRERDIICIGWKWAGKRKVECLTWDENQNSKKMLLAFMSVMNEADEIVAHNGDRFDITWIRTMCLRHGIPMPPKYQSIDTLKECRRLFRFNSNRLDYVAKFLGLGGKIGTNFDLWKDILLKKCDKSLKKMVRYCKHDVRILEQVFDKLNPYMPPRTALSKNARECPECGGDMVKKNHMISAAGMEKFNMYCKACGKYKTVAASRLK